MKILLFADLHMCPRSSIVNKWGSKYPSRLENCIASVNWLESLAEALDCSYIINLGDFFDKPDLSSETITACNEINWSNIFHYSIVGNHDASNSSLTFNSANSLANDDFHTIITEPTKIMVDKNCELCFLPYIVECDRKPLEKYFGVRTDKKRVILSHNDIKGIQLGPVVSRTGFELEEIEANCDIFINGHLHNGQALSTKVINLGNLTGKDFGEDAFKYNHSVAILDTEIMQLKFIENPYAFNFYKFNIENLLAVEALAKVKNNAILSIKCVDSLVDIVKQKIDELSNKIIESRIIITKNYETTTSEAIELDLSVDHLARFIECCKENIENSNILEEELSEICK